MAVFDHKNRTDSDTVDPEEVYGVVVLASNDAVAHAVVNDLERHGEVVRRADPQTIDSPSPDIPWTHVAKVDVRPVRAWSAQELFAQANYVAANAGGEAILVLDEAEGDTTLGQWMSQLRSTVAEVEEGADERIEAFTEDSDFSGPSPLEWGILALAAVGAATAGYWVVKKL